MTDDLPEAFTPKETWVREWTGNADDDHEHGWNTGYNAAVDAIRPLYIEQRDRAEQREKDQDVMRAYIHKLTAQRDDLLDSLRDALSLAEIDADEGALALHALEEMRPMLRAAITKVTGVQA